jgi:ankyrin repeat protein
MNNITLGGCPEVASELLADGADVDFARERGGTTLLSAAAGDRNCSVVDVLISHGAKVDTDSTDIRDRPCGRLSDVSVSVTATVT